MTVNETSVPPHPARQFVDWVDARYTQAGYQTQRFSAFELGGWTVVVGRDERGEQLRELVEAEWFGSIEVPPESLMEALQKRAVMLEGLKGDVVRLQAELDEARRALL